MGCSQATATTSRLKCATLLGTASRNAGASRASEEPQSSLLTTVDGMPGFKEISGFIPLSGSGVLIGSGSDPRSVILHSASLGGTWISHGCQDAVVAEETGSRFTAEKTSSRKTRHLSKRWLVAAYDAGFLKVVEVDVISRNDQLYVHAVSAGHQREDVASHCGCNIDVGTEANMALASTTAAPVATSSSSLGYGVLCLAFSLQQESDDATTDVSTQSGGQISVHQFPSETQPSASPCSSRRQWASGELLTCTDICSEVCEALVQKPNSNSVTHEAHLDSGTLENETTPMQRFACC